MSTDIPLPSKRMAILDLEAKGLNRPERRSLQLFAMLIVTMLVVMALVYLTDDEDIEDPESVESDLRIDHMFTQLVSSDNLSFDFDLRILITNQAEAPAEQVKVEIAGIDNDAKLTYDKQDSSVFNIPAENTTERSVRLTLPRVSAHKMFVMVFAGDELKIKGYAIISVEGSSDKRDFQVTYQRENQGITYSEEQTSSTNKDERTLVGMTFTLVVIIEIILLGGMLSNRNLITALGKLTGKGSSANNSDT